MASRLEVDEGKESTVLRLHVFGVWMVRKLLSREQKQIIKIVAIFSNYLPINTRPSAAYSSSG
jgi:hypothetical protein